MQIDSNTRDITYSDSGVVSYLIDGYEQTFSPESIKDFTPELLEKIKTNPTYKYPSSVIVDAGKPFAKVITGIDYYFVVALDAKKAESYKVDDIVTVRIIDIDKEQEGMVYYKSNEQNGKTIVAIKVSELLNDLAGLRVANIDLIKSSYSGLKVPINSLVSLDGNGAKAKIMAVKASITKLIDVDIKVKNDDFAIIDNPDVLSGSGINLYDNFIQNPGTVKEGQMIYDND